MPHNTTSTNNSTHDNPTPQSPNTSTGLMKGALHGIKVLDLSRVLAGPSCTQVLADLGAEVIKVERPKVGDETRHWSPPSFLAASADQKDIAAYFATINRNKQSITVDITTSEGQAIIKRLAKHSDVLVENFKVGGLQKYGLDYDSLKQDNPHLIYASLTGFGQTGPEAKRAGYDYIIQGMSGLMSITGPADGEPHKVGVAVVDLFAGLYLTIGIQAALLARQQTGEGQLVDVALLDSAIAMLANVGMNHLASGNVPPRLGNAHPNIVPYQVFAAQQGQHFIVACGNDGQFVRLCEQLGVDWHLDERFSTNPNRVAHRDALIELLSEKFEQQPRDVWLEKLQLAQVPCSAINNIAEAIALPQVQAREMVVNFTKHNSNVKALGSPIKLSQTPVQYQTPPPQLGEHTQETLLALGYDLETINKLKQNGII